MPSCLAPRLISKIWVKHRRDGGKIGQARDESVVRVHKKKRCDALRKVRRTLNNNSRLVAKDRPDPPRVFQLRVLGNHLDVPALGYGLGDGRFHHIGYFD